MEAENRKHTKSSTLLIPSREDFHRFTSNYLSAMDFCTEEPSRFQVDKVAKAISWTISNEKKRNANYTY